MSIYQLAENLLQFLTREERAIRNLQCVYSMFSDRHVFYADESGNFKSWSPAFKIL